MKFQKIIFLCSLLISANALAEKPSCNFNYWEPISHNLKCDIYYLPDFSFKRIESNGKIAESVQRFCSHFEVKSKFGSQETGYCYTGSGDRTGPHFRLGDKDWNFSKGEKDRIYFADLNFQGCYKNKKSQGVVFGPFGWRKAPASIKRSWPLRGSIAECAK